MVRELVSKRLGLLDNGDLLGLFVSFLLVLIAVELLESMKAYLDDCCAGTDGGPVEPATVRPAFYRVSSAAPRAGTSSSRGGSSPTSARTRWRSTASSAREA